MKRKDDMYVDSAILNHDTFVDYMYRAKKISTARFKWINVPDSWDIDFLENTLYEQGMCGAIWDENYGNILTRTSIAGSLNIYEMPTKCNCYGINLNKIKYVYNGVNNTLDTDTKDCVVLIKNNPCMIPTISTVKLFCQRLSEIERTMDINLMLQKTPAILSCDQKTRLTLLNLFHQYKGNQPFIYADKHLLDENSIKAINLGAPYLLDKLLVHKQLIWTELLTFLGINNISFEKKERLISSEAEANNHCISLNLKNELRCRKHACEQINKYFGLNIDVDLDYDLLGNTQNVDKSIEIVESGDKNE